MVMNLAVPLTVVGCLLLAGCGPDQQAAPASPTTRTADPDGTSPSGTNSPSSSNSPSSGVAGSPAPDGTLTLAFGGDVHFSQQLAPRLARPERALAELRPYLATADLAMVNLETAITTRGVEQPKKFHFRAPPSALDAVAGAGVDVVTMANNHAVDYGADGFADTLAARARSPIPVVGLGSDRADALRPAVLSAEGVRVAFLGATQVPDWTLSAWPAKPATPGRQGTPTKPGRPGVAVAADPTALAAAVRAARTQADVVVVYLHWGTDYTTCPNPLQRSTAKALAAAGADVVVGTHAHRVQGGGWMGSTYVDYGLGNFVWWRRNAEADARSGVLTVTLRGRRVVAERWTPLRVSADGIPRAPRAAERTRLAGAWQDARRCTGLSARPTG